MASIDSFLGSSLQSLNSINKNLNGEDGNMKKIVDYLYTLTEQLRYALNHIDEENLTDKALVRTIEDATSWHFTEVQQTSDAITAIVSGLNAAQKAVRVVFDSDGLTIKNGGFKILDSNDNTTMSVSNAGNVAIVGSYETETWRSEPSLGVPTRYWSSWDGTRLLFHEFPDGADSEIVGFFGIPAYGQSCRIHTPMLKVQPYYRDQSSDQAYPSSVPGFKWQCRYDTNGNLWGPEFEMTNAWMGETIIKMFENDSNGGGMLQVNSRGGTSNITLNGQTGVVVCVSVTQTSSKRYKEDIKPMPMDRAKYLYDMKFSSFKYIDDELDRGTCYGLIAEDVAKLGLNDIVMYDEEGRPDAIDYTKLIPYMGKLIQEQDKRIKALEMKQ